MNELVSYIPVDPYELVAGMIRVGLVRKEIARALGLTEPRLDSLIQRDERLNKIFKEEGHDPNFQVEQSLFRRAIGYQYKEVKKKLGRPVEVTIKQMAPDTAAAIFWLKNRDPDRWRDHIDIGLTLRDRMHIGDQAKVLGYAKNVTPKQDEDDG